MNWSWKWALVCHRKQLAIHNNMFSCASLTQHSTSAIEFKKLTKAKGRFKNVASSLNKEICITALKQPECVSQWCMCDKLHQSRLTLSNPMDCNTGVGRHDLLQGIFLTQGSNLHLLHLPTLTGDFFTTSATEVVFAKEIPPCIHNKILCKHLKY